MKILAAVLIISGIIKILKAVKEIKKMKILNFKKIGEEIVAAIQYIENKKALYEEEYEPTQSEHALEMIAFYNGKIAGIEEVFKIIKQYTK